MINTLVFSLLSALLFATAAAAAPAAPAAPGAVKGVVLEVRDVEAYSYLRLKTQDGEVWAAVNRAAISKGTEVTIENPMVMTNFESKSLKKTFDKIVFGTLSGDKGSLAAAHAGMNKPAAVADVKVAKAGGSNGRTVSEVVGGKAALRDKTVVVRGSVVKFNSNIMGRNWVHLRDGSGSAADNSNDLLVTTKDTAKVGDVVVAKGIVHTDRDFGAGYRYKVLVEDASLQK